jgi:hypothetical protein
VRCRARGVARVFESSLMINVNVSIGS